MVEEETESDLLTNENVKRIKNITCIYRKFWKMGVPLSYSHFSWWLVAVASMPCPMLQYHLLYKSDICTLVISNNIF